MLLSLMNAALLLSIHLCATVDKMYPVHTPDLSYFSGPLKPLHSHRTARLSTDPVLEFSVHSYQICKLYRRFVAVRCSPLGRSGCDPNVDAGQPHSGATPVRGAEPSQAAPEPPAAPCPGRAEPPRLCLRGLPGQTAHPPLTPQRGRGCQEESEAEAGPAEAARPQPPQRGWLGGDRRLRCG